MYYFWPDKNENINHENINDKNLIKFIISLNLSIDTCLKDCLDKLKVILLYSSESETYYCDPKSISEFYKLNVIETVTKSKEILKMWQMFLFIIKFYCIF